MTASVSDPAGAHPADMEARAHGLREVDEAQTNERGIRQVCEQLHPAVNVADKAVYSRQARLQLETPARVRLERAQQWATGEECSSEVHVEHQLCG